jgi:hypothetical protein
MRDPDLVVRAQQAATALESAWCHWRNMHGLGTDPVPPVSSYVGYSLDAPWGEARIVFGICAEEAEQLATLLKGHDCFGPVHASVTAKSVGRSQGSDAAPGQPRAGGLVHVPAPAPASAGQQPRSAGSGLPRKDPVAQARHSAAASALTRPSGTAPAGSETPIALAASRAVEASMASRKKAVNGSSGAPAGRAGEAAASGPEHPQDGDDCPDPGSRPVQDRAGEPERPAAEEPADLADAAAVTAVGGLPPVPVTQPVPRADAPAQGGNGREPAGGRTGNAGQSSPEIVAFRPRPEPFSQPGSPQQDETSPVKGDDAVAQRGEQGEQGARGECEGGLARPLRAPALSRLMRPGAGADHAPAPERAPASSVDEGQSPAAGRPQDGRDRVSSTTANADAATWAASELPGQAAVTDTAV